MRNAFWGKFLEVRFRTSETSQKLLQKSALQRIRLLSVLIWNAQVKDTLSKSTLKMRHE